jgi:hypothetical protein
MQHWHHNQRVLLVSGQKVARAIAGTASIKWSPWMPPSSKQQPAAWNSFICCISPCQLGTLDTSAAAAAAAACRSVSVVPPAYYAQLAAARGQLIASSKDAVGGGAAAAAAAAGEAGGGPDAEADAALLDFDVRVNAKLGGSMYYV